MTYGENLKKYCDRLQIEGLSTSAGYYDINRFPSKEQRLIFIKETVPELYVELFQRLINMQKKKDILLTMQDCYLLSNN